MIYDFYALIWVTQTSHPYVCSLTVSVESHYLLWCGFRAETPTTKCSNLSWRLKVIGPGGQVTNTLSKYICSTANTTAAGCSICKTLTLIFFLDLDLDSLISCLVSLFSSLFHFHLMPESKLIQYYF